MVSMQLGEAWVSLSVKDGGFASGIAGAVSGAMGSLGSLGMASIGIGAITGALGAMVSAANPALMEQISFAFSDLLAALGHGFMPLFEVLLPALRFVADVIYTYVTPALQFLTGAVIDAFKAFYEFLQDFVKKLTFGAVDLGDLKLKSAAGLSGQGSAKMGDIAGAGREAMVKSLQASAGQPTHEQNMEGALGSMVKLMQEQIQVMKNRVLGFQ